MRRGAVLAKVVAQGGRPPKSDCAGGPSPPKWPRRGAVLHFANSLGRGAVPDRLPSSAKWPRRGAVLAKLIAQGGRPAKSQTDFCPPAQGGRPSRGAVPAKVIAQGGRPTK